MSVAQYLNLLKHGFLKGSTVNMGKSKKKHPFSGITTSETEKKDKQIANKRLRLRTKQKLKHMEDPDAEIFPEKEEVSNVHSFDKDGKCRFDPELHPKLMRK